MPLIRKFFEDDILSAVHTLETLSEEEAVEVIQSLPPNLTARALAHMQVRVVADLLEQISPELFAQILDEMDPQRSAAIFLDFPQEVRDRFLDVLPEKLKEQIREYLTYPEDSAGRIMTTDFLSFYQEMRVRDVIRKIRLLAQRKSPSSYAYVVDEENRLVGIMNMRDLMLASGDDKLGNIINKDFFSVNSFMDREQVAEELSKRRYFAAPVIDSQNHLIGVVKAEQLIEDVQEEATEDIQKMFGAGGDERAFSTIGFSLKKRLPWLNVNLATAFLAASVVAVFEGLIAKITILAVFLPVVAGQGGNAGAQSLAVVMRGLVMREIPQNRVWPLVLKEVWIGTINGFIIGLITAGVAWIWSGNPFLGVVIGLAMIVNLAIAGFAGAAIPLFMKAAGLDPAQCSNIILTTITDVMGFFSFLGFAVIFQNFLL